MLPGRQTGMGPRYWPTVGSKLYYTLCPASFVLTKEIAKVLDMIYNCFIWLIVLVIIIKYKFIYLFSNQTQREVICLVGQI